MVCCDPYEYAPHEQEKSMEKERAKERDNERSLQRDLQIDFEVAHVSHLLPLVAEAGSMTQIKENIRESNLSDYYACFDKTCFCINFCIF